MQTSLARRQARRMNGGRRKGGSSGRNLLVAIPLFLFGSMALVSLVGLLGVVGLFSATARACPTRMS